MSKRAKIILGIIAVLFIVALIWFGKKNKKSIIEYETETPFRTTIVKKTVATGKVTPLEEIEIKPQITGIIDRIMLLEGAEVNKGDLIATVRVVLEVTVVVIGWYLGGTVGVGTLFFAFGIGPAVALGLFIVGKFFN